MIRTLILLTLTFSTYIYAGELIEGYQFISRSEYHSQKGPCACPSDSAKRGRCGKRAALCRNGGANILDCSGKKVESIQDYKKVKRLLCGQDF